MTDYTYSRVAALNFTTTPVTVGRSATGSVYAIGDTTFTTPLNVTTVVGGVTGTSISSDANGFFPDFTVANRTSVVFKQAGTSFTSVLTTTDPVPGPQGTPGTPGATGATGPRGDLASWQASTFYPLNQAIINPVGDIVKVVTAHTSGVSYDATKFDYANNTVVDAQTAAKINDAASATRTALNATYVGQDELVYNVFKHGLVADSGVTDNSPALTALIATVPLGAVIHFPWAPGFFGFGSRVVINRAITLRGNWNQPDSAQSPYGSLIRPTNAAAQLAMQSLFKVSANYVKLQGLSIRGIQTTETAGTVTVNGTLVQLSTLTATSAMVGARISGPFISDGTTVASVNTGANTLTLSTPAPGEVVTSLTSDSTTFTITFEGPHDFSVGQSITLSGFTPAGYNGTWSVATIVDFRTVKVTSAANLGTASVIGTWTAPLAASELWLGGDGIVFSDDVTRTSHNSELTDCNVAQFTNGVAMGFMADHIKIKGGSIGGNFDGILVKAGNENDLEVNDVDTSGNRRASLRLAKNASITNILTARMHLGFSRFGIFQDVSTNGNGIAGMSMVGSPIEFVSTGHIRIANGGAIDIDGSSYWTWTNGSPAQPAFAITRSQNQGSIRFAPHLVGTNANCPYLFYAGVQSNSAAFFSNYGSLAGFAAQTFPFASYNSAVLPGSVFFNGAAVAFSPTTNVTTNGALTLNGRLFLHNVTKTATYSTNAGADLWVRATANSWTLTLTQSGAGQTVVVTNEGAGTITLAVSAGSYFGPATIAAGHGATFVSDGTNWRCIGAY